MVLSDKNPVWICKINDYPDTDDKTRLSTNCFSLRPGSRVTKESHPYNISILLLTTYDAMPNLYPSLKFLYNKQFWAILKYVFFFWQNAKKIIFTKIFNNVISRFNNPVSPNITKHNWFSLSFFHSIQDERRTEDHNVTVVVEFAIALMSVLDQINRESFQRFRLRIGLNHGPVIAGVIGAQKPQYDIWSNTVNVASRMDSCGIMGRMQVSKTHKLCWVVRENDPDTWMDGNRLHYIRYVRWNVMWWGYKAADWLCNVWMKKDSMNADIHVIWMRN